MKKLKELFQSEHGNIMVIMAVVLILLVAICGIVIDTGLLIEGKIKLHSATKSAAKATIEAYDIDVWDNEGRVVILLDEAKQYANQYLHYNLVDADIIRIEIPEENPNQVILETKLKVNFIFMPIFGINDCDISSTMIATGE